MVSVLRRDGTPHPRCVTMDGADLETARRRKETTYPELSGQFGRTKLVVLAAEVAGRWSEECQPVGQTKVRGEVPHLRARCWHAVQFAQWLCRCSKSRFRRRHSLCVRCPRGCQARACPRLAHLCFQATTLDVCSQPFRLPKRKDVEDGHIGKHWERELQATKEQDPEKLWFQTRGAIRREAVDRR